MLEFKTRHQGEKSVFTRFVLLLTAILAIRKLFPRFKSQTFAFTLYYVFFKGDYTFKSAIPWDRN